jgi:hypothetical protein
MPVFDQGYQHWSGTLSGHTWRWVTITRHGVRAGMKNPLLRILVLLSWLPAAVLVSMLAAWGLVEQKSPLAANLLPLLAGFFSPEVLADARSFRVEVWTLCFHYFLLTELYFSMIVVLLVGPGLISQDLRFNALPLYFSRPLRRVDYFVGKLGVIAWFLGLVVIGPLLLAYVLGLLFSLDITVVRDTFPLLLACLAYGAVIVLSAGTLVLALSSLSRNSRYVALFWVALWFVGGIVGLILDEVDREQRRFKVYMRQAEAMQAEPMPPAAPPGGRPPAPEGQRARQQAWQNSYRKMQEELLAEEMQAARTNWRPMVSYTANLWRIGHRLLNTDPAWRRLSEHEPPGERDQFLLEHLGPQYPWYWSAIVLAALFGLSACILNYRVRSLDRLR